MAKLADAPDLGSGAERRGGSSPSTRTIHMNYRYMEIMEIKELKSEGLKREYHLTIPASEIEGVVGERLQDLAKTVEVPGFRKGRVPLDMVRKKYGDRVNAEAMTEAAQKGIDKILAEKNLRTAMEPELKDVDYKIGTDLKCKVEFEIIPDVKEIDYSKLKLERISASPSDEKIEEHLKDAALHFGKLTDVKKKRKIQEGDFAVINFKTHLEDGEELKSFSATDFPIEIGKSMLPGGLDEKLIGQEPGETLEVKFTFPTNFNKDLAGKNATYHVEITGIKHKEALPVDDELAKKVGHASLAEFKENVKSRLQKNYDEDGELILKRQILDQLEEKLSFDLPETLVQAEYDSIWNQLIRELKQAGHEHPKKAEEEKLKKQYRQISERRVKLGLYLAEVGRTHNIKVSEEELKHALFLEAQRYPGQQDKVIEYYRSNPNALANLRAPIFENHVIKHILRQTDVKEKKVKPAELEKMVMQITEGDE